MKTYHLEIEGQSYEVTVGALDTNPVQVIVNGETLEVWLQEGQIENVRFNLSAKPPAGKLPASATTESRFAAGPDRTRPAEPVNRKNGASHQVLAPIPGVITDLLVKTGQTVQPGEPLCSLEAMKMKNVIRASREGEIAAIHVSQGQHVSHQELLMEYVRQEE